MSNYPSGKCPYCGSNRFWCAEKIWNEVENGEIIGSGDSDGFTGEFKCANWRCGRGLSRSEIGEE
jgi:hypothetical protein